MPVDVPTPVGTLLQEAILFVPRIIAALVIFSASLALAGLAQRAAQRALAKREVDLELSRMLARIARWATIVLGLVAALEQVNFNVTSFLAGLGIMGLTLGFALQDIAKNFVAGVLLIIQQPFNIGDAVKVAGYEGDVIDISITYTTLKMWDGVKVCIPNAKVYVDSIANFSALPLRRRCFGLRLGSDHDPEHAVRVFLEAVQAVSGVAPEPAPFVNTTGLPGGQLEMQVCFYVDQSAHNPERVHSQAVHAVRAAALQNDLRVS